LAAAAAVVLSSECGRFSTKQRKSLLDSPAGPIVPTAKSETFRNIATKKQNKNRIKRDE